MSSVARTYEVKIMFENAINKVLTDKFYRSYTRTDHIHWPSEASIVLDGSVIGSCLREGYYKRRGFKADKEVPIANIRKMRTGKDMEQSEIELAKEAGLWLADDVGFQFACDNIIVSGKVDAIFKGPHDKKICVEYKTSSGWNFVKRVFGGTGTNREKWAMPKMEHVMQVMCYLHALPELSYGILFYINRDNMQTIEHKIELRSDHILINGKRMDISIQMITDRYKLMTTYLKDNTLPPPDYTAVYKEEDIERLYADRIISKFEYDRYVSTGELPGEIRCSWCQWSDTCKATRTEAIIHVDAEDCIIEDNTDEDAPMLVL
jgi:hypothetical protein